MQGYLPGECHHSGLRAGISDSWRWLNSDGIERRDIDDDTAPLLFHIGQDILTGQEHAFQVNRQGLIPGLLAGFNWPAISTHPDIVMENVNPAKNLDTFFHHTLTITGSGHIGLKRNAFSAFLINVPLGLLSGFKVVINGHYFGAFSGEDNGGSLAVAHTGQN
ncbi:hypothetical protein ES703_118962 [subsurface metagenome]